MNEFAKLYNLGSGNQVLIDSLIDEEYNIFQIVCKTFVNNKENKMIITYQTLQHLKLGLDGFTLNWAIDYYNAVKNINP